MYHTYMEMDYSSFLVEQAPPKAFYIPNFITEDEEEFVLRKLYDAPKPKWVQLSNRRLQNWGGLPHPKGMVAERLPDWLKCFTTKIDSLGLFDGNLANHVLVNEYLPGQGIMPHEDGPLFYPTITTINLGSHTMLDLYGPLQKRNADSSISSEDSSDVCDSKKQRVGALLLEPRSLLILQDQLYTDFLHGIEERSRDVIDKTVFNASAISCQFGDSLERQKRLSLTIRHFPKVLKFKILNLR